MGSHSVIEAQYRVIKRRRLDRKNCFVAIALIVWQRQLRLATITATIVAVLTLAVVEAEIRLFVIGLIIVSLLSGIFVRLAQIELEEARKRRQRYTNRKKPKRPTRTFSFFQTAPHLSFKEDQMNSWLVLAGSIGLGMMIVFTAPVLPELGWMVIAIGVAGFFAMRHEERKEKASQTSKEEWYAQMSSSGKSPFPLDDNRR